MMLTDVADAPVPRLLSPEAIADLLGVSRRSVYRWVASHELPAVRTSLPRGRLLVRRADLEAFLKARQV